MQAGEPGERASRQLRSAPLCLCNGKNPLGTRRKISAYAPPAQQSWARPAVDGGTRARDGAMVVSTPRASALLRISPKVRQSRALPSTPIAVGCGAVNSSFGMLPRKALHLPSSGSLASASWWGKLRLLRGNVRIWQGRISSDGGSVRTAVIYGAWHSHGYIHTHMHMSHPQLSQSFYSVTFGPGILFWCLESPAQIAEPTIAAVCSTAYLKKLCTSSIIPLAPKQILSSSAPSRAKSFVPPRTRLPFTFSFLHCISTWSPFCPAATEEGSGQQGQHPPSPQGAGASSLCLAGADIFLSVSLVSLVSSFFFLIEPLIKKKKNKLWRNPRFGALGAGLQLPLQALSPWVRDPWSSPGSLGFAPKLLNLQTPSPTRCPCSAWPSRVPTTPGCESSPSAVPGFPLCFH